MTDQQAPPPVPPFPAWAVSTARWVTYYLRAAGRGIWSRRGAPSVLLGVTITALTLLFNADSMWTAPALLAGVALIAIGVLGPRLRVKVGFNWAPEGADISFDMGVAARPDRRLPRGPVDAGLPEVADGGSGTPTVEVIEGEAKTVEVAALVPTAGQAATRQQTNGVAA